MQSWHSKNLTYYIDESQLLVKLNEIDIHSTVTQGSLYINGVTNDLKLPELTIKFADDTFVAISAKVMTNI